MASIKARGCHKLAEATTLAKLADGTTITTTYTLRSDGVVLQRKRFRPVGRSAYSTGNMVYARLKDTGAFGYEHDELVARFRRVATNRGWTVTP